MRKKSPRRGSLAEYIAQILKNAVYEKGEQLDVIVAEAPDLPGCMTQGATIEEARENLVDAIEVWLMSGLRSGEDPLSAPYHVAGLSKCSCRPWRSKSLKSWSRVTIWRFPEMAKAAR
jgi:predicted RNase H-like HicB family nuclease